MATGNVLNGKQYAGNPHVRFDGGEVAPAAKLGHGALPCKHKQIGGMKTGFGLSLFGAALSAIAVVNAAPTIEITKVQQRWPWNNKLDISYTVGDGQKLTADPSGDTYYKIVFTTTINGTEYTIDGDALGASANTGTHTVTWKGAPAGVESDNLKMSAAMYAASAPSGDDYMIVQLTGEDAGKVTFEGLLKTQALSNARYNVDEYKSNKLVLRKIPCGTYTTGDSTNYNGSDSEKNWTTYREFYTALFTVTQQQYLNLGLSNPSYYTRDLTGNRNEFRPVERISWYQIRGAGLVPREAVTPASDGTFLQRLNYLTREKSGVVGIDLPTTIMSEIAARAGHAGKYAWGTDNYADGANQVADSSNSKWDNTASNAEVGTHDPNDWGLYDTTGNVFEWVLDDYSYANIAINVSDPFTPLSGDNVNRRYRGGGSATYALSSSAYFHASNVGHAAADNATYSTMGFRVAIVMD